MKPQNSLRLFRVILFFFTSMALAGPGGHFELVNFSPYNWKLVWQHSYQMDWQPADLIPAGGKHEQYVEWWYHWGDNGDCGAEAIYHLEGTEYEFTVQARQRNGKKLLIEFNDALAALTMTREKVIDLGFDHDGSVLFVLSGNGVEPYVSSQAPKNWMQMTLQTIGSKELRQISMPMSHNAGIYMVSHQYLGNAHNSQCQTRPIYFQLSFGARWFDLRPAFADGKWLTSHGTTPGIGSFVGVLGAPLTDIINDLNRFTAEVPGEFIVLELSHELYGGDDFLVDEIPPAGWQELYKLLEGINDLWQPKDSNIPHDLTTLRMSSFIQPGSRSAVIVRIPNQAESPFSGNPAFVREDRMAWTGDWTQTSDPAILDADVMSRLNADRKDSKSALFRLAYTITPRVIEMLDIANSFHSIIGESMWAEHKLFQTIWDNLTPKTYPNLIEVDNIHNSQVTAISMVINQRYANAPQNNIKRDQSLPRRPLLKLSVRDLMAEELLSKKTPGELHELDVLASSRSSLSAQQAPETAYPNPPTDIEVTVITTLITTPVQSLEARFKGPKRKGDHVWVTGTNHEWDTLTTRRWHTNKNPKSWCWGSWRAMSELTPIATVVYEFRDSTKSSTSTVTLSIEDHFVSSWYPNESPPTWDYVMEETRTDWFTVPTTPTLTPSSQPITIVLPKTDWTYQTVSHPRCFQLMPGPGVTFEDWYDEVARDAIEDS